MSPLNEVPWELVADQTLREVIAGAVTSAVVAVAAALVVPERCHARYARLHVALLASQVRDGNGSRGDFLYGAWGT